MGPNNDHDHTNGGPNFPSSLRPPSGEPSLFHIDQDEEDDGGVGVLPWDPLAPRLLEEAQRLAKEGKDRPFTAAVVLATALPFSGAAVFFGGPVLVGDAALQWGAGTPIGRTVGHGTRNAVEVRWRSENWPEVRGCLLWPGATLLLRRLANDRWRNVCSSLPFWSLFAWSAVGLPKRVLFSVGVVGFTVPF